MPFQTGAWKQLYLPSAKIELYFQMVKMPFKDECKLCGRVFPYNLLRRCWRCRQLFCQDCMVPEVTSGDPQKIMCIPCARRTVSPRHINKYDRLKNYLKFRSAFTDTVKLTLTQIDGIIGDNLPIEAYRQEEWWQNDSSKAHAKAWLQAGWKTAEINLKEKYVIFQKTEKPLTFNVAKKDKDLSRKPFTPAPSRIAKTKKPSKTKLAKMYARLKNIERQRKTQRKVR
ncbi:MAG: FYVE zinc finger domain-containing protein [Candidatus Bathyarchaeota archaeon]|nr:FYVE zinc finger domain-containing protein [Candidatus Bathyarchaeota archaeon]